MESKSPAGKLDLTDVKKLAASSIKVGAAAALTYFGQNVSGIDFGDYNLLIVGVLTILIDAAQKTLKDNTKE